MKTKLHTFRSRIIVSLIIVFSSVSLFAFYLFNNSLNKIIHEEHEKNVIAILGLFKDQFYNAQGHNEGKIIFPLLDSIRKNQNIKDAYLLNSHNKLVYPTGINPDMLDSLPQSDQTSSNSPIVLKTINSGDDHFTRAFIPLQNSKDCNKCHSSTVKYLGTIVVDLSLGKTKRSINFARKFSLIFTTLMLLILGGIILLIHYKFVKKALKEFHSTINSVNQGNFYKRLSIPETKEFGELGISFNKMLDNFQNTQNELQIFHKNELRNNYKLATIGEMASRLAHEIRNPITGIASAIEIIHSEITDEKNKSILAEVQRQANRVNQAITELLKYSRQKDVNFQESNINELIKSLVFFLENQSHTKKIVFKQELQEDIPVFRFDHGQMEDVFLNLGINAIQSIQNEGTVTFKTEYIPPEKVVTISVCDSGRGIPEEIKSKIFHPFFTTRNEGTGLGLAIVKDIIDKHKGEIWVENNPGGGCTFIILLPLDDV